MKDLERLLLEFHERMSDRTVGHFVDSESEEWWRPAPSDDIIAETVGKILDLVKDVT